MTFKPKTNSRPRVVIGNIDNRVKSVTPVLQKDENLKEPALILDIDIGQGRGVARLTLNAEEDHSCIVEQFCFANNLNEDKRDRLMDVIQSHMQSILHPIVEEVPSDSDLLLSHYAESP